MNAAILLTLKCPKYQSFLRPTNSLFRLIYPLYIYNKSKLYIHIFLEFTILCMFIFYCIYFNIMYFKTTQIFSSKTELLINYCRQAFIECKQDQTHKEQSVQVCSNTQVKRKR